MKNVSKAVSKKAEAPVIDEAELASLLDGDADEMLADMMDEGADDAALEAVVNEAEVEEAVVEANAESTAEAEPDAVKTPKAKKAPAKPKVDRTGMTCSQVIESTIGKDNAEALFTLVANDPAEFLAQLDNEENKVAKKVKEKVQNVFNSLNGKGDLSCYTKRVLELLVAGNGECTLDQIKENYLAKPYSKGTTSAQSSQIMQLYPLLRMATVEGKKLVVNKDSALYDALVASLTAAPAAVTEAA